LALDRRFRSALLAGAWLTAVGGAVRLGSDTFAAALAGQILIAIAQPLILNAVTKIAVTFVPDAPAKGISLGSAGIFAGTALALPLGPALADADSLAPLLIVDLVVAVSAAAWLTVAMRGAAAARRVSDRTPTTAPRHAMPAGGVPAGLAAPRDATAADRALADPAPAAFAGRAELRAVWADRAIRRLAGVAFLGFGVFVALTTWLQALLEPAGVSDATAGWLLGAMVLAGVVGAAVLPAPLAKHGVERVFLRTAAVVAAAGCAFLAVAPSAAAVTVVPLGIVLLGSLPVILELTERRSKSSAATALIWLGGNAGGIVVAVLVQATQNHPGVAFSLLAVTGALVLTVA
jgi:cyanate permease